MTVRRTTTRAGACAAFALALCILAGCGARRVQPAATHLQAWREFEDIAAKRQDRRNRPFLHEGQPYDRRRLGSGLVVAARELRAALAADSTLTEAWLGLAHLELAVGDAAAARLHLARAEALMAAPAPGHVPPNAEQRLDFHRDRAWALHDLALWDEGLAAAEAGLDAFPGDPDLMVAEGLLLAGGGRFAEAMSWAAALPPLRLSFDSDNEVEIGLRKRPSAYAAQWIRARAWAARGDVEMALHVLGEDPEQTAPADITHGTRAQRRLMGPRIPRAPRYWNDLGELAERNGSLAAVDFYVKAWRTREYAGYYPSSFATSGPLVLGRPDARFPYFASFYGRHYQAGSRLGYVAALLNRMSLATSDVARREVAEAAFAALDVAERRGLRPDVCRALRGRLHYRLEQWEPAHQQLARARLDFEAAGAVDPRTSLLLGMLDLRDEHFASAAALFEESLEADPAQALGWRMLGVAYASQERFADAAAAMDRAVALEPGSLAGRYNRGLLLLQLHRCADALVDLDLALRLDPGNAELMRLAQLAGTCDREDGGEATVVRAAGATDIHFETDTNQLVQQLADDLAGFFHAPEGAPAEADDRLAVLEQAAVADAPAVRGARAVLLSDLGRYAEVRALLAPSWPDGLRPPADLILLYADWQVGDTTRLRSVVADALAGRLESTNPYLWALVILEIRRDPQPWGPDAEARVLTRWFDLPGAVNGTTIHTWAEVMAREMAVARGGRDAPLSPPGAR